MKNQRLKLNAKFRQLVQTYPIPYVVFCAAVGYVIGRAIGTALDD